MDRRRFIVAGFSAAAVGSALGTDACSSGTVGTSLPIGPSPFVPVYQLTAQYALSNIKGYRLRTRTYNGATIGPKIETRPGETLVMRIVNRLPPNSPAQPPQGRVRIPHIRNSMEAMDAVTRFPTRLSTRVSSMNDPHDFNTTNLHVHGIQTIPHILHPSARPIRGR